MYGTVDDSPYAYIPGYGLASFRIGATFGVGRYDASA